MKGLTVKEILRKNKFTQQQVADLLDTTVQNLSQQLAKDDVRTGLVEAIAAATGLPVSVFYGDSYVATTSGENSPAVAGHDNQVNTCAADFLKEIAAQRQVTDKVLDQNAALLRIIEKQTK